MCHHLNVEKKNYFKIWGNNSINVRKLVIIANQALHMKKKILLKNVLNL